MLCKKLKDPFNVEQGGEMLGLGLINAETIFEKEKTRTRVQGQFDNITGIFSGLNGKNFEGYEIHMGITTSSESDNYVSTIRTINGEEKADGICCGNVYGSYVHGIFDSSEVLTEIAKSLMEKKGLIYDPTQTFDIEAHKQKEYDKLADILRQSLDMEMIYNILDEGIKL